MKPDDTEQFSLFSDLPALTEEERDDARFRGKDLFWSRLVGLYDEIAETDASLSYQTLGDRVGLSRSQVQRWLDSPQNMTLQSAALLAEGLDADFAFDIVRRHLAASSNECHPADAAAANAELRLYLGALALNATANKVGEVQGWSAL